MKSLKHLAITSKRLTWGNCKQYWSALATAEASEVTKVAIIIFRGEGPSSNSKCESASNEKV